MTTSTRPFTIALTLSCAGLLAATVAVASPPPGSEPESVAGDDSDALVAAAQATWTVWQHALVNVDDPDATAAVDDYFQDDNPTLDDAHQTLDDLAASDHRYSHHPTIDNPGLIVEDIDIYGTPIPGARLTVCAPTTLISHPADTDLDDVLAGFDTTDPHHTDTDGDRDRDIVEVVEAERAVWRMQFVPGSRDDDTSPSRWWLVDITVEDTWVDTVECPPPPPPTSPPTTPPTTLPPTTTDPLNQDRLDVTAAAEAAHLARVQALDTMGSPEAMAAVDRYYVAGSKARLEIDATIRNFEEAGVRSRYNPDVAESVTVEEVEFLDSPPTRADLIACIVDAGIIYEPATDDFPEVIVNDTYSAGRVHHEMHKIDGQWQVAAWGSQQYWPWETECPPAV